jgi:hypothetical protein
MNTLDKITITNALQTWYDSYKATNKAVCDLEVATGAITDSPLYEAIWNMFDNYTDELTNYLDIPVNLLSWWLYDNDAGKRKDTFAGTKIPTIKVLANCIYNIQRTSQQ